MLKTIYMLCGIPGSGKSTWAKQKKSDFEAVNLPTVIVATDAIREELYGDERIQGDYVKVFDTAYERIEAALNDNTTHSIIYDATNLHRRDRLRFLNKFKRDNVHVIVVYFNTPCNVALERNRARDRHVSETIIKKMSLHKDVPAIDEPFYTFWVVNADSNSETCYL